MRTRVNTYTGYSVGCAGVWAAILAMRERRLDPHTRSTLRLLCGGWWVGWTSATVARVGYPPPNRLTPRGERRLRTGSLLLVAGGLISVVRLLATGTRREAGPLPENR